MPYARQKTAYHLPDRAVAHRVSPAPSIVVFGASFPDWLFCLCGGVAGMVAIHLLLRTPEKRAWLAPQLLTYPALTALIAMLIWLLVFPH